MDQTHIPTTKTRMIDGKQYRRLSETNFFTSEKAAKEKVSEIENNGYKGRSYHAKSFRMSKTIYSDETVIIIQYFIYIRTKK